MSEPTDEWVTVAEAAARLEVDARQVRRWTARLSPKDRSMDTQRTHKGQPVSLVRLSAVEEVRDQSRVAATATESGDEPTDQTRAIRNGQSQRTHKGHGKGQSDPSLEEWRTRAAVAEAQVAELRERVASVEKTLVHEQETTREALAGIMEALKGLKDTDARLATFLAATERVSRRTLVPPQEFPEAPDDGEAATRGDAPRENADAAETATEPTEDAPQRGSFWSRLFGRGGRAP